MLVIGSFGESCWPISPLVLGAGKGGELKKGRDGEGQKKERERERVHVHTIIVIVCVRTHGLHVRLLLSLQCMHCDLLF